MSYIVVSLGGREGLPSARIGRAVLDDHGFFLYLGAYLRHQRRAGVARVGRGAARGRWNMRALIYEEPKQEARHTGIMMLLVVCAGVFGQQVCASPSGAQSCAPCQSCRHSSIGRPGRLLLTSCRCHGPCPRWASIGAVSRRASSSTFSSMQAAMKLGTHEEEWLRLVAANKRPKAC